MFLSIFFKSKTTTTLILVMAPMLQVLFDGSVPAVSGEIKDMSGLMLFLNWCTSSRWLMQMYVCYEIKGLPSHVRDFDIISTMLENKDITTDDMEECAGEAFMVMVLQGLVFRFLALILLFLTKHAEGDGLFKDILFVINSGLYTMFEKLGCIQAFNAMFYSYSESEQQDIKDSSDDATRPSATTPAKVSLEEMDIEGGSAEGKKQTDADADASDNATSGLVPGS